MYVCLPTQIQLERERSNRELRVYIYVYRLCTIATTTLPRGNLLSAHGFTNVRMGLRLRITRMRVLDTYTHTRPYSSSHSACLPLSSRRVLGFITSLVLKWLLRGRRVSKIDIQSVGFPGAVVLQDVLVLLEKVWTHLRIQQRHEHRIELNSLTE